MVHVHRNPRVICGQDKMKWFSSCGELNWNAFGTVNYKRFYVLWSFYYTYISGQTLVLVIQEV
jgi:hypothetical protein